jgi:hypothetical protein
MNWKKFVREEWPNFKVSYYPGNPLEGQRETTEISVRIACLRAEI